jgi:hypothetical protein
MGILDQLKQWFTQSNPTDVNQPKNQPETINNNQENQVVESQNLNIDHEEVSIDEQIETIETPISTPIYQSVPKTLQEQLNDLQDNATLSLWPPHGEYPGPIIINNSVVLDGQGATIWATQGPVLSINSHQVTLRNLRIEVTGEIKIANSENNNINCAILVKSNQQSNPVISFENIEVRGSVMGISEEEGEWQYPSTLNIGRIAHGQEYNFIWRIIVPVDCKIISEISGIEFTPRLLNPGKNAGCIHIEKLPQDTLINGSIYLVSANLKRRISVTAHIVNFNSQDISISDHHVIWEAESWSSFSESIMTETTSNISETITETAAEPEPEIKIIQPEKQPEEKLTELPKPAKIDAVNTTEKNDENTSRHRTYKEVKPNQIFASAAEKLNQQQKQSQIVNSDNSTSSTPINPIFQSVENQKLESANQNVTPATETNDLAVINPIFKNYSPVNKSVNSENVSEQNSSQASDAENPQNNPQSQNPQVQNSQAQKRTQARPNKIFMDK